MLLLKWQLGVTAAKGAGRALSADTWRQSKWGGYRLEFGAMVLLFCPLVFFVTIVGGQCWLLLRGASALLYRQARLQAPVWYFAACAVYGLQGPNCMPSRCALLSVGVG